MARIKQMQGVPAQLQYLQSDGERRHPSYCKYHEGVGKKRICLNIKSHFYKRNCKSAAKCDWYEK